MSASAEPAIPSPGNWPVDPQDDVPILKDRIWVDGCFDFTHHGHAGAMLQARRLGKELVVGVHSDEAILENKGPTVMTLEERVAAVEACRWASHCVPHAPYVTSLPWVSHYGCYYVVHGDDITSDSSGDDCYRFVKAAGRFRVVKRTPGISTTDLVGRMLLCTKTHFIKSVKDTLAGEEGLGSPDERKASAADLLQRIRDYATDESGLQPGPQVWTWIGSNLAKLDHVVEEAGTFETLFNGKPPKPGQRVVYVDGGFDLFSSGHIEFLRQVISYEETDGRQRGWYDPGQRDRRIRDHGEDYGPSQSYLETMPFGVPGVVYHGPTTFIPLTYDPYVAPKRMGIFKETGEHPFQYVNAGEIVGRILKSREAYEERQRTKLKKSAVEELTKLREASG
ncbi:hypothetical protein MPDQ_005352 [Monascus purpureus]|uniref:ethanolamine-phosphate cytidylyltransferase n=1 Tax=Monascus purpureus TaxID=5098 RepID=A0A507QG78_MONPU|nr:hypothetical protein MPDQ_005352 [Monascus purpureus]